MGVLSFTLMRPSALLCASLVFVAVLFPEEAEAGKKGVPAPVKHLFGVGLGYQKVVQYKPVLVISKGRRPKPKQQGWGWGGGLKGGYSPLVIEEHVHKQGKSGYAYHAPSHHHRRKRKRPPHRNHHHHHSPLFGGVRGWGGWRQGWRRPHRSHKKGHGHGGYRHYDSHSHHHHGGVEAYHHHSPPEHYHHGVVEHSPHHEILDHPHHEIAEDPPHHHGIEEYPSSHHGVVDHPSHHDIVHYPPHHEVAHHPPPRHPISEHLHHNHKYKYTPHHDDYPGITVYGSSKVSSHPGSVYPASPSSTYFGHPSPSAGEVEDDHGGYETEIHESWNQDAPTTANTPTSSSTSSPAPPNFPFQDFTRSDASITTMHRDFMKNHMKNYQQFQEYTQATTLQPREDSNGKLQAPFRLQPPGPFFSTMDPQSSSEVQYDDDYPENKEYDYSQNNNNGIDKKSSELSLKKSSFSAQTPTATSAMQSSASNFHQVITAMPSMPTSDNTFKPSQRIDELVGIENSFSTPEFFPTFQQFRQMKIT